MCSLIFHADGRKREKVEDQIPGRIVTVLTSRPEAENTRLSVVLGLVRDRSWTEGKKVELKGSEIRVIYDSSDVKKQGRIRVRWEIFV